MIIFVQYMYNPAISWITPPRGLNMKPPRWDAAPAASPAVPLWRSNVPGDQGSYMYYVYI